MIKNNREFNDEDLDPEKLVQAARKARDLSSQATQPELNLDTELSASEVVTLVSENDEVLCQEVFRPVLRKNRHLNWWYGEANIIIYN